MQQESIFIEDQGHQLHLKHIYNNAGGVPILMVHGVVENGRIFYTEQGKGLGCYLAEQGFDVYVMDLRGRGLSTPLINAESDYGQYEAITHDIPLLIDYVFNKTGQAMHLISHSWGGVLVASVLARHSEHLTKVRSNLCFGTKRMITIGGFEKYLKVDLFYNRIAPKLAKRKGFLDAVKYKIGADNETKQSLAHSITWVNKGPWHDPFDGFDYQSAAGEIVWPPTWHITGIKDSILGNQVDVKHFIEESKNTNAKFSLLAKRNGNAIDYGHIDILTSSHAINDHFPVVADWLKEY
ncbi:alpha/beta fold hydrolase [Thalassotalea fonticola]|uniref:Alpha/beta fold hydrolase n=1 Tax=Thalassotalea fonticola TaxID=3065649 RepID=A0ABZ0GU92_9GAMM|nr:alpha/beta fold hydrolase [Colwelliaceae bacterium S1-1]